MRFVGVQSVAEIHTRGTEIRLENQLHGERKSHPLLSKEVHENNRITNSVLPNQTKTQDW